MNVHLQIGNGQFVLNVQDAAKIMEMLNKATPVDNYYIDGQSGHYETTERYYTRVSINQIEGKVITHAEYTAKREAEEAREAK